MRQGVSSVLRVSDRRSEYNTRQKLEPRERERERERREEYVMFPGVRRDLISDVRAPLSLSSPPSLLPPLPAQQCSLGLLLT